LCPLKKQKKVWKGEYGVSKRERERIVWKIGRRMNVVVSNLKEGEKEEEESKRTHTYNRIGYRFSLWVCEKKINLAKGGKKEKEKNWH
jgi:hypothetical protein